MGSTGRQLMRNKDTSRKKDVSQVHMDICSGSVQFFCCSQSCPRGVASDYLTEPVALPSSRILRGGPRRTRCCLIPDSSRRLRKPLKAAAARRADAQQHST